MVVAKNLSRVAEAGTLVSLTAEYCASPGVTRVVWLLPTSRVVSPGHSASYGIIAHNVTVIFFKFRLYKFFQKLR